MRGRERRNKREAQEELRRKENNEKEKKEGSIHLLPLTYAPVRPGEKGEGDEEKVRKRERSAEEEFMHTNEQEREEKNKRESWKRKKRRGEEISSSTPLHTCVRKREKKADAILSLLNLHIVEFTFVMREKRKGRRRRRWKAEKRRRRQGGRKSREIVRLSLRLSLRWNFFPSRETDTQRRGRRGGLSSFPL